MNSDIIENLYHNCRSCHWYVKGKCLHKKTFVGTLDIKEMIQDLSESGIISEAIRECFSGADFSDLKFNLESSKLSKKKTGEIMESFYEELEANQTNWIEAIDEAILRAIQNSALGEEKSVKPDSPDNFYCKYFT